MCAKVAGRSKSRVKLNAQTAELCASVCLGVCVCVRVCACARLVHNNPLETSIKYEIQ